MIFFPRFAWVIGIKDKKGASIVKGFQSILKKSGRKPSKIWVDHGSEFYNKDFKEFLKENDIEMYSPHNEGKSVLAEIFIRTLKNKVYKHMTTVDKNVYFNVLDDIVDKYNNTYHGSIKMKPKDVTDDSFVYNEESNKKDLKFKVGDNVRVSSPWTYIITDLNGEEIMGIFYVKWKNYDNSFNSWFDKKDLI